MPRTSNTPVDMSMIATGVNCAPRLLDFNPPSCEAWFKLGEGEGGTL